MNAMFVLPGNGDLLEQALMVSVSRFSDRGLPMTCGSIEVDLPWLIGQRWRQER